MKVSKSRGGAVPLLRGVQGCVYAHAEDHLSIYHLIPEQDDKG